jgi:transcriptional regulator with XRE-family HTH domain
MANSNLDTEFPGRLGAQLRAVRKKAGLTQGEVCRALGMRGAASRSYLHRLEAGKYPDVALRTVVRYLQACKAPIGKLSLRDGFAFMLELAQSGAFGEGEPMLTIAAEGSSLKLKQERRAALRARQKEREELDADVIRSLWVEVMPQITPLLPKGQVHFYTAYRNGVRAFYLAWKRAKREARGDDPAALVNAAFDTVERAGIEMRLVPAAVRKMREIVFDELLKRTPGRSR